ncbi:MAG: hypothetical protein IPO92_15160 [Saprospiraceae bacterium]|nr:hypothetical protein [Saprospiraceae bacterium]
MTAAENIGAYGAADLAAANLALGQKIAANEAVVSHLVQLTYGVLITPF